jgi:DNA mismatch repair protein MutS2
VALEQEVAPRAPEPRAEPTGEVGPALDWRRARPGDRVAVAGAGTGVLESLPDRRGRVKVSVGTARLEVASDRVRAASGAARPGGGARVTVERASDAPSVVGDGLRAGGIVECDLRGQRVAAALERLSEVLDRAARDGVDAVRIVHGIGGGALMRAVREHLGTSSYVVGVRPGVEGEGGDGVTFAELRH